MINLYKEYNRMGKIRAVIIGAGGYGGCGAIELLLRHPDVEIVALLDKEGAGEKISNIHPHLKGFCDQIVLHPDEKHGIDDPHVVFFATPDGVGQKDAPYWLEKGAKVIDYSGDFRFSDPQQYGEYAKRIGRQANHLSPELLKESVYGLPELHGEQISKSRIVGNPGCFAVSCILGLAPALHAGIIIPNSIVCDAKTGVSGAGKAPKPQFHYPSRYEAMNAYRIGNHQHVIEIEKELKAIAKTSIKITFTPHVVPLSRGILTTIYGEVSPGNDLESAIKTYKDFYKDKPFIRICGPGEPASSVHVRGSNLCSISINHDERTNRFILVSMIDNLIKGQAGNAIQNMNLMFGLDETAGLNHPGQYP
jgi:N-acetyl-gamma-glutamyl-phosphate reductase